MTITQATDLAHALEGAHSDRFIYLIEFTNGIVKVGQTKNPRSRMEDHAKEAGRHGNSIARSWVSQPHSLYKDNEKALIAFCRDRWLISSGAEYFLGADFDAVVEYAQGLELTLEGPSEAAVPRQATLEPRRGAASGNRKRAKYPLDHRPEAVQWARKQAGLTKTQLAERLGVSLSLISEIESGSRNATPANLNRLAEALNCPRVVLERKRADQPEGDAA